MRFTDRVALITGASRGVGAAVAVALAREGCKIVAAAKTLDPNPRLPGTLRDTVRLVEEAGSEALAVQVDVRFPEQVESMVQQAIDRFGRIDYLINNAGAIFWSPLADWPVKKFDLVMGVNVRAAYLCSAAVIPHMRKQGYGHILTMSPPINPAASVGKAPYLVSKIGMTMVAMAIDAEEKDHGIAASSLWPITALRTAAMVNLAPDNADQWRKPEILADATCDLMAMDPKEARFRAWLDEDLLEHTRGMTNFDEYSCVPGSNPPPMSIQLVDPTWSGRPSA
jgi:citronellol/citronellal dehydrogenase